MDHRNKYLKIFCLLFLGISLIISFLRYLCPIKGMTLYYGKLKSDNNSLTCDGVPPMKTDKYFISHAESFSRIGMIKASLFYRNFCNTYGELEEITHIEFPALDWSFLNLENNEKSSTVGNTVELVPMSDRFFQKYGVILIQRWNGDEKTIALGSKNQIKIGEKFYFAQTENSKKIFELVNKYFGVNIIQ